jgi:SAM-dependent methyltransferase
VADAGADITARMLADAGLGEGMRVLDVGCGRGDVALLAAALVGASGHVTGIDSDADAIAAARARARELGVPSVGFEVCDLLAMPDSPGAFDAAVGRRVLMYQPDAAESLRRIAASVRPGGLVAFQEHDSSMAPISLVPLPLHDRVRGWIWQTVEREGADVRMGLGLAAAMEAAGLHVEHVRAEAIVQRPDAPQPLAAIVGAMLPRMLAHDVASEAEIDIGTLAERLSEERVRTATTSLGELVFCAWARTP